MIHRGFSVPVNVRLPTPSSHSQIRRRVVLHQNSYGRFRLGAAGQIIELRQAENDPKETFPDCMKRDPDPLIPNQSVGDGH